jgi:demethylmenaquinone methyltransferase/2-methoxy-6-polyprenyl-1,4-benzoquinol methylase
MDELADYYARRAPEYERFYDKPERQADLSLLRERVARLFAGRKVLEIACGTGYWSAVMARDAREVTALDVNEEVLALARGKPLLAGSVEFLRADAYALPDFGRRHDGVFAGFWWSHVPRARLDAFLGGCLRAAAPGAMIAFLDGRYVEGSSTPIARRDAEGNSYQTRGLDDGSAHEVMKNYPEEGELIQRASRFGWGAHVELLPYHWLLTFWAPR